MVSLLLLAYYLLAWVMVGRDPEAGVVITRYEPPVGLSPGTSRYVDRMGYDHKTFAAALVNLAVKGLVEIKEEGREYTLTRTSHSPEEPGGWRKGDPETPVSWSERDIDHPEAKQACDDSQGAQSA